MASLMSQPAGNRAPGYCSNVTLLSFCSMWPLCTLLHSAGIQMHTHPLPAEVQISALHLYSCREKKKKQLWHQREDFTEQSWLTCWVKAQRRKKRKKKNCNGASLEHFLWWCLWVKKTDVSVQLPAVSLAGVLLRNVQKPHVFTLFRIPTILFQKLVFFQT